MPMPYDATLKDLLERGPADWVALAGHPGCVADLIDADVSTVTAASDKVIRVQAAPDWLLDLNFQRGPDTTVPQRMHLYATVEGLSPSAPGPQRPDPAESEGEPVEPDRRV